MTRSLSRAFSLFLLLPLFGGCSSTSVLISSKDPVFESAQSSLIATEAQIDRLKLSPGERALFIQAESFYNYRFEPPTRGSKSFFAEAAAAITDFPAFQALAGSLDLFDLRLRSVNAAAQLWETLLVRYPQSTLRPFTLYRLGWSYRSTDISGLPRESPDEPFELIIKEQPGTNWAKFAADAKAVPWKSKGSAATRSLLPGLGQIYVGETGNGVLRMSIAAVAAAAVLYPILKGLKSDPNGRGPSLPLIAMGVGGLIVLSFDFTSSYEDAMRGVVQWNERAEAEFKNAHPGAP